MRRCPKTTEHEFSCGGLELSTISVLYGANDFIRHTVPGLYREGERLRPLIWTYGIFPLTYEMKISLGIYYL